jgi:hypothetical protein
MVVCMVMELPVHIVANTLSQDTTLITWLCCIPHAICVLSTAVLCCPACDDSSGADEDAELADVNPFDLASPSSSSDSEQQQKSSRKKQKKEAKQKQQQQQQQQVEEGPEEEGPDLDLNMDDIMGGSDDEMSDEDDIINAAAGGSSDDEEGAAAAAGGSSKGGSKSKQKGRQKGAGLFADASAYDNYFAEFDKVAAAAETDGNGGGGGGGDAAAAAADGGVGHQRSSKRGDRGHRKGGSKKHRQS